MNKRSHTAIFYKVTFPKFREELKIPVTLLVGLMVDTNCVVTTFLLVEAGQLHCVHFLSSGLCTSVGGLNC